MRTILVGMLLAAFAVVAGFSQTPLLVPLTVQEFSGVARTNELVRSGVPMPRHAGLYSAAGLRLLGPGGIPVPARLTVLGRWASGPADTSAPVRWVLVEFPASVAALGTNVFTLTSGGPGPTLTTLTVNETATNITITTGPARFEVSKTRGSLLESAWLDLDADMIFSAGEQILLPANDTGPFVVATNTEYRGGNAVPLSTVAEDVGPGRATVRVEGFHRDGGGAPLFRYVTRLTFFAGRSDVHVHHTIIEGRAVGSGNGDFPAAQIITPFTRAGLRLRPAFAALPTVRVTADNVTPTTVALTNAAHVLALRQRTPTNYLQGLRYELLNNASLAETNQRARQAWLDAGDANWGLAVATRDFWRKGPQQLSAAGDGTVTVEFPSEAYTIYQCMGLAEEVLLDFHPATAAFATLRSRSQGGLKDPLFAVAPGAWYVGSGALGELPAYPCTRHPQFDQGMEQHYQVNMAWIDEGRVFGLLNYLDMPFDRFEANTDPHNVFYGVGYYDPPGAQIREFARRGEYRWLRDLAFPHVRHWYTTDCYDVDDTNTVPHDGICPTHGLAHRSGFVPEYHYVESLWDYYYLTGDRRALERGLAGARTYATAPNWRNDFDVGLAVPGLPGRAMCQKLNTILEGWLATGDPALRTAVMNDTEDFLASYGTPIGFYRYFYRAPTNSFSAGQAFQTAVIFLPLIKKYYEVTGSETARQQLLLGPQRLAAHFRVSGDPQSPAYLQFTNFVRVTWAGGATTNYAAQPVAPEPGEDDVLYDQSVTALAALLGHVGALTHNRAFITEARRLWTDRLLGGWTASVWDKPAAQYTLRMHLLLGYLEPPDAPPRSDFIGFELLGGRARMHHQGTLGHSYLLQSSSNLATWLPISTNTPDASGTFSFDDAGIGSARLRFYRAIRP